MVIDTQLNTGCNAISGFRDAFSKIMGAAPAKLGEHLTILKASWLDTQLGPMFVISDDKALYLLEFAERRGLEREIERLRLKLKATIMPEITDPIRSIKAELKAYFDGSLEKFTTPIHVLGSPFQKSVWEELMRIPYGQTRSYSAQAKSIGKEKAFRAVANANGANQLAIIIPCHRIINSNGHLGGYGGGITRKQCLIDHEKKHAK
jgi:AraC family transcriptional regulator of adaptative response/methylated-DNA-[protein]-cysteine methyltransferase